MWMCILPLLMLGDAQGEAPKVRVVEVTKGGARSRNFTVKAELQSAVLRGASRSSTFMIREIADDQGNRIDRSEGMRWGSHHSDLSEDERRSGKHTFLFTPAVPARGVKKLTFKGIFEVVTEGQSIDVDFPKLRSLEGKLLENDDLKAAGLKVKLVKPEADERSKFGAKPKIYKADQRVICTVEGNLQYWTQSCVLAPTGKQIRPDYSETGDEGIIRKGQPKVWRETHFYSKAIDSDATLRLTFLKGGKTVKVPVEFTVDVP